MAKSNDDEAMRDDESNQDDAVKRTKHRSPNYPMFGLRKAVERAQELHGKYKRALVPINLAQELWSYRPHGGAGNQAVAAMRSYGLLEVEGDGKGRRVRITEPAYRILLNSPDRGEQLRKAALGPVLYRELWDKFGVEGEDFLTELVKHYLLFDREEGRFNPESVDSFIENFRDSLRYGGLLSGDKKEGSIEEGGQGETVVPGPQICVGDFVQWTADGVDQFPVPRQVRGFYEDGQWAYVDGSPTGVAVSELTVASLPMDPKTSTRATPPPNPFMGAAGQTQKEQSTSQSPPPGYREDAYDIPEGRAILRWPEKLDPGSVEEMEDWLALILRKMRRTNSVPPREEK